MILRPGEKVHVIHRRQLEKESHRHFIGVVEGYDSGVARVTGHLYTVDRDQQKFVQRPEKRTRLVAIGSGDVLVNIIPESVDLRRISYETRRKAVRVTDGSDWFLDLSEIAWL